MGAIVILINPEVEKVIGMQSKKIALVTSAELPNLYGGEQLLAPALRHYGASVDICVWDDARIDWRLYDVVVIRCPWDYHEKLPAFITWLDLLTSQNVKVINDIATLRWNMCKEYLLDLEKKGVAIIETLLVSTDDRRSIREIMRQRNWTELVLKPVASAGAWRTLRVSENNLDAAEAQFSVWRDEQAFLFQPFMPEIVNEGEWSLLFFAGQFSHAVIKRAKSGDFRVQTDHGGTRHAIVAPPVIRQQAQHIVQALPRTPCYARVDGVVRDQEFLLMEIELLEPELFLELDTNAPDIFAKAILEEIGATIQM